MSPNAPYRAVATMPTVQDVEHNLQTIRWAMKLLELAEDGGIGAVRKTLDHRASDLASAARGDVMPRVQHSVRDGQAIRGADAHPLCCDCDPCLNGGCRGSY